MRPAFVRLPYLLAVLGTLLILAYFAQPVTIYSNGVPTSHHGFLVYTRDALALAGITVGEHDQLHPAPNQLIPADGVILLRNAVPVLQADSPVLWSLSRLPADWLQQNGFLLFPGDRVVVNGESIDPQAAASGPGPFRIEFEPRLPLQVVDGTQKFTLYSNAATLGQALAENGIILDPQDRLSLPPETAISAALTITITRAREMTIKTASGSFLLRTAAPTVGQALAGSGITPQGLDRTEPPESDPLPTDGIIRIYREREVVALAESLLPFSSTSTLSDELELDQSAVVQPGQLGVTLRRERLRYTDGAETARTDEGEWVATEPRDQVLARGTQPVVKTLDTGAGTIEYYRVVSAYATSYSPCQQGLGRCTQATASGIPLAKGVIAVSSAWYRLFAGAQVYIPGYGIGVIGDVGGGIPGQYWVDLGYSEEDFEAWHATVSVYFLTPVPAAVPAVLP